MNRWLCLLKDCQRKAERLIDNRGFCNDHPDKSIKIKIEGKWRKGYESQGKFYTDMGKVIDVYEDVHRFLDNLEIDIPGGKSVKPVEVKKIDYESG